MSGRRRYRASAASPTRGAGLYERTKRELAARKWDYIQDYADATSSVVEEIISRARGDQKHER
jgi:GrpB-like predicted nucleotidyltransferase (UPF0157 family)